MESGDFYIPRDSSAHRDELGSQRYHPGGIEEDNHHQTREGI